MQCRSSPPSHEGPPSRCLDPTISVSPWRRVVVVKTLRIHTALTFAQTPARGVAPALQAPSGGLGDYPPPVRSSEVWHSPPPAPCRGVRRSRLAWHTLQPVPVDPIPVSWFCVDQTTGVGVNMRGFGKTNGRNRGSFGACSASDSPAQRRLHPVASRHVMATDGPDTQPSRSMALRRHLLCERTVHAAPFTEKCLPCAFAPHYLCQCSYHTHWQFVGKY